MVTYNTSLIAQYLEIMATQDAEINTLKQENKKLHNQYTNNKNKARIYRESLQDKQQEVNDYKQIAETWKQAHKDLTEEFNQTNKVLNKLMNEPTAKILECIDKYKRNM